MMDTVDTDTLEAICYELLELIGEDVKREGLRDTPKRWAEFWREFIDYDAGNSDVTFESVTTDQLVAVSGIKVVSLCEHHLLPFMCTVHIAYLTRGKVLGLSKFARVAQQHAHKLQLQERLCSDIAQTISQLTETPDVAVMATGVHLCMLMRGIKQEACMQTSVMLGKFRETGGTRDEVLQLWKKS